MRVRFTLILILLTALFIPINARAAESSTPDFQQAEMVPGELIVIMKSGADMRALNLPEKARASAQKHNGLERLNARIINVPIGEERAYIPKLKKQKDVQVVEPNYIIRADFIPNDPAYSRQYSLPLIQAPTAWNTTIGAPSVILAIIDSGLDATHPEFAGRIVSGYDFIQHDSTPQDECGHGTHVTGIAAATGNNGEGIAGVAWNVSIMPLRVLDRTCRGNSANLVDALIWAVDHGARVINLSIGTSDPSTLMENAVYYAYTHGAAIFAAAGNDGENIINHSILYPARYDTVMAVGSVNSTLTRAASSSYDATLDLMAPGVLIYSTLPMKSGFAYNRVGYSTEYDYLSGTSMASPHAAGAAALLASLPCFDTPEKIYQALKSTARDLGNVGVDDEYGYGLIQIADALNTCPNIAPPSPVSVEYDLINLSNCNTLDSYNWIEATHHEVSPGNSSYTNIALPFAFTFGGVTYNDSINAHANGFISMGDNNTNTYEVSGEYNYQNNSFLPGPALPNNFIAPFWDDLTDPNGLGGIYTQTLGSAPNRQFVIEYHMQKVGVTGSSLNFEVILYEGSNNIKMQYRALAGAGADGSSATVGLEYGDNASNLAGYSYSYNQKGALQNGLALLFVPYASGTANLPSAVCPQTRAKSIEAGASNACNTLPTTFDVQIAANALPYRSTLKIQQLATAPVMPVNFYDLHHYADITLRYTPPAISLVPMPEVYVCYEYTPQDVLAAGGHPENLFIAAHDITTRQWSALPTSVDALHSWLLARAPHFSYYGVATLNPNQSTQGLGLPVTGSPLHSDFALWLILLAAASGIWLRRKNKRL